MDKEISLSGLTSPLQAQLHVGGALPYDWELFEYIPKPGGGWQHNSLGSGKGEAWFTLPHSDLTTLQGHALVWSVAVVNFDKDPLEVTVRASVKCGASSSPRAVDLTWKATREAPRLFVTLGLKP